MKYYLFPKNFQHYPLEGLMEATARMGFNGPTALIRDGYWISRSQADVDLPRFVKAAQDHGLTVGYGSADLSPADILSEDSLRLLKTFAQNGIAQVRLQYMGKQQGECMRALKDRFTRMAEDVAEAGRRAEVQCVVQLHGYFYPHNATAAYECVKNCDPKYLGIKMDPGNNLCQEGFELFWYQTGLLGEYIAALGAKDVGYFQAGDPADDNKGWGARWLPAYEGMINYKQVFSYLHQVNFNGPVIQMPFYEAESDAAMEQIVAKELQYFQSCT
ncbi:MAG: sugar phosphate isomerase/epimerase, partial [Clostridia bacterium]|nr:sugar phosphate isomerase/epimerase [Clostridia bacterium]